MTRCFADLVTDESGATLVEYALIVGLIVAACVTVLSTLGARAGFALSTAANHITAPS